MKKENKLYNVLFPFWMILMFPITWLVVLPGNFAIDSLVLLVLMLILKVESKKQFYIKHIFKIFAIGLLSDAVGSLLLFAMLIFEISSMGDELFITIPAMIISAVMIFLLNYFITFKKSERALRLKMALTFAIITAPYTFLIPTSWIY